MLASRYVLLGERIYQSMDLVVRRLLALDPFDLQHPSKSFLGRPGLGWQPPTRSNSTPLSVPAKTGTELYP